MTTPKVGRSSSNKEMHYSVGTVIQKDNKFLLIDRQKLPYGYAGVAGHIDEGEDQITALHREVLEESGLQVTDQELLFEEEVNNNQCSKGINTHYWFVFSCKVTGTIKQNIKETKSIGWFTKEKLATLPLEPVWQYWFEKLNIIRGEK